MHVSIVVLTKLIFRKVIFYKFDIGLKETYFSFFFTACYKIRVKLEKNFVLELKKPLHTTPGSSSKNKRLKSKVVFFVQS